MTSRRSAILHAVNDMLKSRDLHPVLVDVGASGSPHAVWDHIADKSVYIGFDPDARELKEIGDGPYMKSLIINEAITSDPNSDRLRFHLTSSPYCSSSLPPDVKGLSPYLFADLFKVLKEVDVKATTLDSVMKRLSLERIDWLKVDTQGTDLRIFRSLSPELRSHVMALDVEPGLINAYLGEDTFVETHRVLTNMGFWLSDLSVPGAPRLSPKSLAQALQTRPDLNECALGLALKKAPSWCEARYLRSIESISTASPSPIDFFLLWAFSLMDNHHGFAYEVGLAYAARFPDDPRKDDLAKVALDLFPTDEESILKRAIGMLPSSLKSGIKHFFGY